MNEVVGPCETLVESTLERMKNKQPHVPRRFKRLAAVGCAAVIAAGCVTPALAANVPVVYEMMYMFSPSVAQFIMPVNKSCEDQGVKMEVVSVAVHENTAEICLTLQDVDGTIFGDSAPDLYDSYSLNYPTFTGQTCGCVLVDYDKNTHTAVYHIEIINDEKFRGSKYTFSFREMLVGKKSVEGIPLNFDLSSVPLEPGVERQHVSGASSLQDDNEIFSKMDYDFLKPQGTLWESDDGIFTLVAAGYREGQLHLLYRTEGSVSYDNHMYSELTAHDGSVFNHNYTVSYKDYEQDVGYDEYVYDIGYSVLGDYSLTADIYTASDKIAGNWRVTFRVDEAK